MRKRWLTLAMVILAMAMLFAACNSTAAAGVYTIKTINGMDVKSFFAKEMNRSSLSDEEFERVLSVYGINSADDFIRIKLNEDHTSENLSSWIEIDRKGEWRQSGSKIQLGKYEGTYKDGEITVEMDYKGDKVKIVLSRKAGSGESSGKLAASENVNASGNGVPVTTGANEEADNRPQNVDDKIEGTYKLQSVNGMSIRDYYEEMAAAMGIDAKTMLSSFGVNDIDSLSDRLGFTLYGDGTASFGQLSFTGFQIKEGLWHEKGNGVEISIFDAKETITVDASGNQTVTYSDKILDCEVRNGVITMEDGLGGDVRVYCKPELFKEIDAGKNNGGEANPGNQEINVGSAEGVYQIKLIDGKDAKEYYIEKYNSDSYNLETQLSMMEISSIDTLKEEMSFTLHADGTVTYAQKLEDYDAQTGTWTQDGQKVTLTLTNPSFTDISGLIAFGGSIMYFGNGTIEYTFGNNQLTFTRIGESLVFERVS